MNAAGRIAGSALLVFSASLAAAQSLFADPLFLQGFRLTGATHAQLELDAHLRHTVDGPNTGHPPWRIAQWGTRHLLQPGVFKEAGDGALAAANEAKRITLVRGDTGLPTLRLELNGDTESGGRLRKYGEPWPHLLLDQAFENPIRVGAYDALPFALSFRVPRCEPAPWASEMLDPSLHTAQVSAFFTVHRVRNGQPQRGEMLWFGIPLVDARSPIPPGHQAQDAGQPGASGKFICVIAGERFWDSPTGDGKWQHLAVDLRPLLSDALAITQAHGHLEGATLEDLALTSFNLGWEVTGPYNAAIEIRGLRLESGE